jgi:16S rRNA (adenine1518-N6/adenine1519-N6)-dimethyltransferase
MRSNAKQLLDSYGLRPKRSFGQNFLMDPQLAARIAELATTPRGGSVVEIGAGTGALTRPLLERAQRVVAIERDRDLLPVLRAEFELELSAFRLVLSETDAKTCDWLALLADGPRPKVIAGNLPYQITGPLLQRVTQIAHELDRVVFLMQREVAERLTASPGSSEYGALSVFVQNRFDSRRAFVIRRGAFYPQPGVDSAVIVLTPRPEAISPESETFRGLVRAAFAQRRKTLRNAWQALAFVSPSDLEGAAKRAAIDLSLRGEVLAVEAFARMTRELEA